MGKEYTKAQVAAAFEKAGARFSDEKNREIGIGITLQLLNDPLSNPTRSELIGRIGRLARVGDTAARQIVGELDGGEERQTLSQQFANAAHALGELLFPPQPSAPAMTGSCADVRRTAAEGGPVNQAAARSCLPNMGMN